MHPQNDAGSVCYPWNKRGCASQLERVQQHRICVLYWLVNIPVPAMSGFAKVSCSKVDGSKYLYLVSGPTFRRNFCSSTTTIIGQSFLHAMLSFPVITRCVRFVPFSSFISDDSLVVLLRFLLGASEGGISNGLSIVLGMYWTHPEIGERLSWYCLSSFRLFFHSFRP